MTIPRGSEIPGGRAGFETAGNVCDAGRDARFRRPRIWPALVLVTIYWAFRLIARHVEMTMLVRFASLMLVLLAVTLSFLAWWFVRRRTHWVERIAGAGGAIVISAFCCTDLKTGKRVWRQGEYGHGQVLLLVDQGLLLVTSEEGQIVLVRASPQGNEELDRST